ncbi:MAG: HAMP domain-containing histidine kinase [Bacteroidales bacterium]|nr:HAMP domain-containing histidine kinase [Bacteroidales bacterium]
MKRWFRTLVISVFALAALSLVVIQFVQTRRTFSISDNMFNVSVNNAMDEVVRQMSGEVFQTASHPATSFNYQELDSLIAEELLLNGIDLHPVVGIYDGSQGSFLYSSDASKENRLEESPYRYNFSPIGVVSSGQYFITLAFPDTELFLQSNTKVYLYMTLFLLVVIATMFFISLRTLAAQRRLDQMKTEFINNMTHEIKTPISTIGLACEMLRDETVSQDAATRSNFLGIISDENQRMRVLVETILQSAKMSNKNFAINPKEVDINSLTAKVLQSFRLTIANRGGSIEAHLDASPSTLEADELHITNMVYNLVDNAIKYSVDAPRIVVTTLCDNENIVLSVKDHGIGIAKENQKRVFEKFYRVSTGNVHNVKGFGIGLNYVAQVVRLHHGHISLESELGQGSTFTVKLPLLG